MRYAGLLVLAGCGIEVAAHEAAIVVARDCSRLQCDTNAATVGDGIIFDRLAVDPRLWTQDLRLTEPTLAGEPVTLSVEDDHLRAWNAAEGKLITAAGLRGLRFKVEHRDASTGQLDASYQLRIGEVYVEDKDRPLPLLRFREGEPNVIESYDIRVEVGDDRAQDRHICTGTRLVDDPWWNGTPVFGAIIFEGDDYDDLARTVVPSPPGSPAFNLACLGTAMSKMHALRHTEAGRHGVALTGPVVALDYPTALEERNALLKMLTADYCGNGYSFTENGTPLYWEDPVPWRHDVIDLKTEELEAIWTPTGARCLNKPRHAKPNQVASVCKIPRCTTQDLAEARGHALISATPP